MIRSNETVPQMSSTVKAWRGIAMLLALGQLASPPLIARVFGDFLSTGAPNDALITPALALTANLRATPGYVAAALWALVAVAVGATNRGSAVLAGTAGAASVLVAITAAIYRNSRHRRARPVHSLRNETQNETNLDVTA